MNKKFIVLLLVCSVILSCAAIPVSSDNVPVPVFRMTPGADSPVVVDSTGGITGIMSGYAESEHDKDNIAYFGRKDGNGVYFNDGKITLIKDGLRKLIDKKSELSVNFWINRDSKGTAVPFAVNGGSGAALMISVNRSGTVSLRLTPGVYDSEKNIDLGNIESGKWVFVTVNISLSSGTAQLYENAELIGEKSFDFLLPRFSLDSPVKNDEFTFVKTAVDDITVYANTLDAAGIGQAMNLQYTPVENKGLVPVSTWSFDRTDGNIVKASGSKPSNGTLVNSNLIYEGVIGKAGNFPGEKLGYMDMGKSVSENLQGASAVSVSFWMRNKAAPSWGRLISLYMQNEKALFHVTYNGGASYAGRMILTIGGRSCPSESYKQRDYNLYDYGNGGDWIHVVGILDFKNKQITAYLNGEYSDPYAWNGAAPAASVGFEQDTLIKGETPYNDCVGGDAAVRSSYPGYLDEVAFYDRALTAEEVQLLYMSGASGAVSKLTLERENIPIIKSFGDKASAFYDGVGFAIHDGKRVWFNDNDHSEAPVMRDDKLYLPLSALKATGFTFTEEEDRILFPYGSIAAADTIVENGVRYVGALRAAKALNTEAEADGGLVIFKNGISISEQIKTQYLWLLTDRSILYPERSHNKTRVVVAQTDTNVTGTRFGDPSIALRENGDIIATYIPYDNRKGTEVHLSKDGGKTFENIAFVPDMGSATPFEVNGVLYLMGIGDRVLKIVKSTDGGYTWTTPGDETSGWFERAEMPYPHGITPILFANGRIYRAFEEQTDETGKNQWVTTYRSYMVSAPVDCDLLNENNWTFTNLLNYDFVGKGWSTYTENQTYNYTGGWLEGNAVASPDGKVYNMLRLQTGNESGYAALCTLSEDNKTLSFDINTGIIDFEGGMTKFLTRYDEKSGYYVSVSNIVTDKSNSNQRNVVGLNISKDLRNWETVEILLCDESLTPWYDSNYRHGMQYFDWVADGDDMLLIVREAAENSKAYHEANRVTFYRICGFRKNFK